MRLHELVAELRQGQRLRISEVGAIQPLEPEEMLPAGRMKLEHFDGPQERNARRWWSKPLTDAQILAYWNRIVLKFVQHRDGDTIFAIVTPTDGLVWEDGKYVDVYAGEERKKVEGVA